MSHRATVVSIKLSSSSWLDKAAVTVRIIMYRWPLNWQEVQSFIAGVSACTKPSCSLCTATLGGHRCRSSSRQWIADMSLDVVHPTITAPTARQTDSSHLTNCGEAVRVIVTEPHHGVINPLSRPPGPPTDTHLPRTTSSRHGVINPLSRNPGPPTDTHLPRTTSSRHGVINPLSRPPGPPTDTSVVLMHHTDFSIEQILKPGFGTRTWSRGTEECVWAAGDVLPAGCDVLPAGCDVLPAGCDVLPAGCDVLPAGCDVLPAGCDVLPAGCDLLPAGCDVLPAGCDVLPAWLFCTRYSDRPSVGELHRAARYNA